MIRKSKTPVKLSRSGGFKYQRKYTNPRVDIIFKRVFGTERNKPILKEFLNDLLDIEIVDLKFESIDLPPLLDSDGKSVRLDVLARVRTVRGMRWVNIEVQNVAHRSLIQRAIYYGARIYSGQLQSSENYAELNPTMVIFILNFSIFRSHQRPVSKYELKESETGAELAPSEKPLEFVFIELPKVRKTVDIDKAGLLLRLAKRRFGNLPSDLPQQLGVLAHDQLDDLAEEILDSSDLQGFLLSVDSLLNGRTSAEIYEPRD